MGNALGTHGEDVSSRNLPSIIEGFRDYTSNLSSSDKYIQWSIISAIAGALERKTWVNFNDFKCYPNMFTFLIGTAGLSRKSSTSGRAMDLLREVKSLRFLSDTLTPASLIEQLHKAGVNRKATIMGKEYHNASVFLYSSEAVVTLKERGYGSLVELMTDLYDCGPQGWHTERCWEKNTLLDGSTKIFNPCLNMLVCSTPHWLAKVVGPSEISGGFFSRVFFVVERGATSKADEWYDDAELPAEKLLLRKKLVEDLSAVSRLSGPMKVNTEVKALHNAFMAQNKSFIQSHAEDMFVSYYARKPWHILKLCQVFCADRSSSMIIEEQDWNNARKQIEGLEVDMRNVFKNVGMNKDSSHVHMVWEFCRTKKRVTISEVTIKFYQELNKRQITEALSMLVDMYKIKVTFPGNNRIVYEAKDDLPLIV
jgi:hypothetical protein